VHRLQFHYTLSRQSSPSQVRNPLIDLLQAVATHGSISAAARALGLSYRHVWGELKRWENELGNELVVWEKGQSARLTEFGYKLMWAERHAQARLAPQIDAVRADLERAFAVAFDPMAHVVTLYASHDDALSALREHSLSNQVHQPVHLDIRFCGSVDAIRGLNEGRCVLAGFHTLDHPQPGSLSERTYRPLLQPGRHKIIGFARRAQGLIVAPGNPLQLNGLQDLHRSRARFVNRALGSGTRLILDELLAQQGLQGADLAGYTHEEPSHTAVAHAVAAGSADAGLGIEAAARAMGLDFIALVEENYHLVCLKSELEAPAIVALRSVLQTQAWQTAMAAIAGYTPVHCGQILALRQVLPWWDFARRKRKGRATAQNRA
jgi:molybdate transport repressor ModE-like protein